MKLLMNPTTDQQVQAFLGSPTHALTLVGPAGSGKARLADYIIGRVLQTDSINDYPYFRRLQSIDDKAIGIELIRELRDFLTFKVPSQKTWHRAVLIDGADDLTLEAQNAMLKLLEEPPLGTFFVLTATSPNALLPTIRSRSVTLTMHAPSKHDLEQALADQFDATEIKQAYAMSDGLPELMEELLQNKDHQLWQAADLAKQLLAQSRYERLLQVDGLAKNKAAALDLTFVLQQMAHIALRTAQGAQAQRWRNVLESAYDASEALNSNVQAKLVLTNLMLKL